MSLAEAAVIIDAAMRDKSYRVSSLGQLVGRYLRYFRPRLSMRRERNAVHDGLLALRKTGVPARRGGREQIGSLRGVGVRRSAPRG